MPRSGSRLSVSTVDERGAHGRVRSQAHARLRVVKVAPFNAEAPLDALQADLTPSVAFYVRNHFPVPELDSRGYRVEVDGAVRRTLALRLKDLRAMRRHAIPATLECAGNGRTGLVPPPPGEPWQLGAVSTARWTGTLLCDVLERAGLRRGTVEVLVSGADRGFPPEGASEIPFARSLPLAKAMDPDTLLALEMNGEPLPPEHGGPVRLVVPGWYGVASVKWVVRIEALEEPFTGYYQVDRYVYDYADGSKPTPVTAMRVRSLILSPMDGETVHGGRMVVRGKAWSGEGAIARVEVAVEGGDAWRDARLLPPVSPYAWRPWEFVWDANEPGRHVLRSRATDVKGNRQPDAGQWNKLGYGNNAVQSIVVDAR